MNVAARSLILALALFVPWSSGQATWHVGPNATGSGNGSVGAPFSSIQTAIAAAAGGDLVLVATGLYAESLDFLGKGITVRGVPGGSTIIDPQGAGRGVVFQSGEGPDSVLEHVQIRNGDAGGANGGGIAIVGAAPTIRFCIIAGNAAQGGGGIDVAGSYGTRIEWSLIQENTAAGDGGGVRVIASPLVILTGCIVGANLAGADGGGVNVVGTGELRVQDSVIHGNFAAGAGGGIGVTSAAPSVIGSTIARNVAPSGAGMGGFDASPTVINCIVWANLSTSIFFTGASSPNVSFSDVEFGYPGPGNFNLNPRFVDLAGGILRTLASSPCRDAGSTGAALDSVTDADGAARIRGSAVDVGAYEYPEVTGTVLDRLNPTSLRLVTWNVYFDSIFPDTDTVVPSRFIRIVNALDPDVLCLQEIYTHTAADAVAFMNIILPLPNGATWYGYRGGDCLVVSRYPLSLTASSPVPAGERPLAMALVDLPDAHFPVDLYLLNNHLFPPAPGSDPLRQQQADAMANWMRDARTRGGALDLTAGTAFAVVGDFNLCDQLCSPAPLTTMVSGDIIDNAVYGGDAAPDWDISSLADAAPLVNGVGPAQHTFLIQPYALGPWRLDFLLYTDALLAASHSFVLDTTTLPDEDLHVARLLRADVTVDPDGFAHDHLPVVVDLVSRTTFPGSEEDLILTTQVNGAGVDSVAFKHAEQGDTLEISVRSPNGTFNGSWVVIGGQIYDDELPPTGSAWYPMVRVDPSVTFAVYPTLFVSGPAPGLAPTGLDIQLTVPAGLAGSSIRFQAFSISSLSGNHMFAATEAHDFLID